MGYLLILDRPYFHSQKRCDFSLTSPLSPKASVYCFGGNSLISQAPCLTILEKENINFLFDHRRNLGKQNKRIGIKTVRHELREETWGQGSTVIRTIRITTVTILLLINEKDEEFDMFNIIHHINLSVPGLDTSS